MDLLKEIFGIDSKYEKWNGVHKLPLSVLASYEFQIIILNDLKCILITPKEDAIKIPDIKKLLKLINEVDTMPAVLRLLGVSAHKRKTLIENRIAFVSNKQAYLPFIGTYLQDEKANIKKLKKFMSSTQQLVLFYLYEKKPRIFISEAAKKLPFTAMTMSRALKQIKQLDLFSISKEGVYKVIASGYEKKELFQKLKKYLMSPVRAAGYLDKRYITKDMVLAGASALKSDNIVEQNNVLTYAVDMKCFDKDLLVDELTDSEKQVRVELWSYDPKQFGNKDVADPLSVILSLKDDEEDVEKLLESVWKKQHN